MVSSRVYIVVLVCWRGEQMLHLNSKGFVFNEENGGKDPMEEFKSLLAAESTSIHSYEHLLGVEAVASMHQVAAVCRDFHAVNASLLRQQLIDNSIEIPDYVDLWHSLSGLRSGAASFFGEEALLAALRKDELGALTEYESKISCFDGDNLILVQQKLIPNQMKICELLGALKDGMGEQMVQTNVPLNIELA